MGAITDCSIMVLIMRHGSDGEENISIVNMHGTNYFATNYMKQCRGVRENQIRCVHFNNIHT